MSHLTLSAMIRALQHENLKDDERGIVADAYARSGAGCKPWHLSQKTQEHVAVIFGRYYTEH